MPLIKKIENFLNENKSFITASAVYVSASVIDGVSTIIGYPIEIREINPIINLGIKNFGPELGVFIPKIIFAGGVLTIFRYADLKHKEGKIKEKYECLLYPYSALTAVTGLSWFIEKYLV